MFKRARHSAGEDESGGHRTADAAGRRFHARFSTITAWMCQAVP
jgi:hypothetical protein